MAARDGGAAVLDRRPAARSCRPRWARGAARKAGGRSGDLEDTFHLDRDARAAARPPRPPSGRGGRASPKTSTKRSEAPFTTLGWSVKSGAELTKPVSLTTRFTPVEVAAAGGRELGDQRQGAGAGGGGAGGDVDAGAELAE